LAKRNPPDWFPQLYRILLEVVQSSEGGKSVRQPLSRFPRRAIALPSIQISHAKVDHSGFAAIAKDMM
jgi:hypothetical protein